MTADGDRLDPDVAERFRALDEVPVPDTWNRDDDPLATDRADPGRRAWWAVAAAALVVALVAGIVLTRGDGEVVVGPSGTGASPAPNSTNAPPTAGSSGPPVTIVPAPADASAEPSSGMPGDTVEITPASVVERVCLDIVTVESLDAEIVVGQVLTDGRWLATREGATPTYPACGQTPSDAPLTVTLPPLEQGTYRFCLDWDHTAAGCAMITVGVEAPPVGHLASSSSPLVISDASDDPRVASSAAALTAFRSQQALFQAADFPLEPAMESSCGEDSSCSAGAVVGLQRYGVVDRVDRPDGLIGPVATVTYGEVYAVEGIEPAIALVLDGSPEGSPRDWYLMTLENGPYTFTDRADAAELPATWCGVSVRFPELEDYVPCSPAITWVVGRAELPWDIDDPSSLSDWLVRAVEPSDDTLAVVRDEFAAGTPYDEVASRWEFELAGPYPTIDHALRDLADSGCPPGSGPCRFAYTVIERSADSIVVDTISQRVVRENEIETSFSRRVLSQIDDAGLWVTQYGPLGVHQNGAGDAGRADADARVAGATVVIDTL